MAHAPQWLASEWEGRVCVDQEGRGGGGEGVAFVYRWRTKNATWLCGLFVLSASRSCSRCLQRKCEKVVLSLALEASLSCLVFAKNAGVVWGKAQKKKVKRKRKGSTQKKNTTREEIKKTQSTHTRHHTTHTLTTQSSCTPAAVSPPRHPGRHSRPSRAAAAAAAARPRPPPPSWAGAAESRPSGQHPG